MAELLGVVSGGAGLASLAIQLLGSVREIRGLYRSFKDAPEFLEDAVFDLETFGRTLQEMERDRQSHNIVDSETVGRCIRTCQRAVDRVRSAVTKLEAAMKKSKTRGRLYTAFQQPEVSHLRDELDRANASLGTAWQLYYGSRVNKNTGKLFEMLERQNLRLQQIEANLPTSHHDVHSLSPSNNALTKYTCQPSIESAPFEFENRFDSSVQRISSRNRSRRQWRIQVSPWFASKIWELSFYGAQTGWTLNVTTSNLLPHDAAIFEACREGALHEVQRLVREGKASLTDHYDERWGRVGTVLSEATSSRHVQLCRWIMENAGYPPMPDGARHPLNSYFPSDLGGSTTVEMYELFLKTSDSMSEELGHGQEPPLWWRRIPDGCISLVRSDLSSALSELSQGTQIRLAIHGCFDSLPVFQSFNSLTSLRSRLLALLGRPTIDNDVAHARNEMGETILAKLAESIHWVYTHEWRCKEVPKLASFVRELLDHGADIHAQDNLGITPLFQNKGFLSDQGLRQWLEILEAAGVDLCAYGKVEKSLWTALKHNGRSETYRHLSHFDFGAKPSDWTMDDQEQWDIDMYEPFALPGTWSLLDERVPWSICWKPEREDDIADPAWKWRKTAGYALCSDRTSSSGVFEQNLESFDQRFIQDDCESLVRLIEGSTRPRLPPRSSSQPPMGRKPRFNWLLSVAPQTLARFRNSHVCCFDGKSRPSKAYRMDGGRDRECVKGIHEFDSDALGKDISETIEREMRIFRYRYRNLSELRALPYAAYRSKWFAKP